MIIKPCLKHSQSAGVLDLCRPNKPSLAGRTRDAEEVLQVLKGDGPPKVGRGVSERGSQHQQQFLLTMPSCAGVGERGRSPSVVAAPTPCDCAVLLRLSC